MKKIFTLFAALVCMIGLQATTVTVAPNGNVCTVTVDGTPYDNLPITPQGNINLVTINRDGISLLVRYTDTNTVSAIGTVNGQSINYASAAVTDYAKTFQIPNSDFEMWTDATAEPKNWHSFESATGSLQSSAGNHIKKSANKRPGSSGGYSCVLFSSKVFGVVANGTMTTGRLNAGNISATNLANHSYLDLSSTETDNNGDPFYATLKASPDAIQTWIKFKQYQHQNSYPYATINCVITDGEKRYQDPEEEGAEYLNHVAAKATNKTIEENNYSWQFITIPFDYESYNSNQAESKALLVTISTNATPGQGSAAGLFSSGADSLYVDDVELIYNAAISNIALNGVALESFNFNAATKNYDITYSGEALNLTADNFVVTTEGVSAIVVKNVEDLGCGNYRIAIGVTSPDFKNGDLYTINVTKRPIYILGEVNGKDWAANDGVEMDTENGTIYTATVTTSKDNGNYFGFTSMLANDNDDGGWSYIAPYRFGAELNGEGDFWITDALLNTALNLGADGTTRAYRLEKGEWNFSVDMSTRTLTVTKVQQSIPGDVDGSGVVDVTDVNVVVNIILGKALFSNYPNADVDGTGVVDVTDVNKVVNIILGK